MHPSRSHRRCAATLAVAAALALPQPAAADAQVPYPQGYRQWTHVKTMQILPGHPLFDAFGGVHHIYANAKAMQGYRSGRFPEGAVIVFDLREARTEGAAVVAGPRKVVGVMHRDAKRWPGTGGWGFEGFKGESTTERAVGAEAKTACFGCHAPQKARDYVFSSFER